MLSYLQFSSFEINTYLKLPNDYMSGGRFSFRRCFAPDDLLEIAPLTSVRSPSVLCGVVRNLCHNTEPFMDKRFPLETFLGKE